MLLPTVCTFTAIILLFGYQLADGGTYTCKVSNVAGQVDRTFRLTVHGEKNLCYTLKVQLNAYFSKRGVLNLFSNFNTYTFP